MARWKARVKFLLSVIELLFLSLTVKALQGKTCQNSLLSGPGRSVRAKISGGRGRPWRIFFGFYKTRHILLSEGANCTVLPAVVFTQYWHVTDGRTDSQTDRQTDCRRQYSACNASIALAVRCTVTTHTAMIVTTPKSNGASPWMPAPWHWSWHSRTNQYHHSTGCSGHNHVSQDGKHQRHIHVACSSTRSSTSSSLLFADFFFPNGSRTFHFRVPDFLPPDDVDSCNIQQQAKPVKSRLRTNETSQIGEASFNLPAWLGFSTAFNRI